MKQQLFLGDGDEVVIGRSRDCDIALPDRAVSRHHARLRRQHGHWHLMDLDSTHGTSVNQQPILTETVLADGDLITIGVTQLVVARDEIKSIGEPDRHPSISILADVGTAEPTESHQHPDRRISATNAVASPTSVGTAQASRMCWSCGFDSFTDPCQECGRDISVTRIPLDRTGSACIYRVDLDVREGLILRDLGDRLVVLTPDGSTATRDASDVVIGQQIPGIDEALSPAGQLLLLTGSPTYAALRGTQELVDTMLEEVVGDDLLAHRLLAVDALRTKGGARHLEWLHLTDEEKAWLYAVYYAEVGDWHSCFTQFSRLPSDRFLARFQLYLQGREPLRNLPAERAAAITFLSAQPAQGASTLAQWLDGHEDLDPFVIAAAAQDQAPRVVELMESLVAGRPLRDYVDISPEARALDALTSTEGWRVTPADIQGRSLTYIDELIDRGRLASRSVPEYRAVLDSQASAYVTARLDPRQLSDDEVEEYGPVAESERRAFLRGDIKLAAVSNVEAAHHLELVDQALRGSHEALAELRQTLPPDQVKILEGACQSIADGDIPADYVLADRTLWQPLEREIGAEKIAASLSKVRTSLRRSFVAWVCLRSAKSELHSWHWAIALERAQTALRASQDEPTSDEALNLIAAAQFQLGKVSPAFKALEKALQGGYNAALQSNAVSVAGSAPAKQATALLAKLVAQAPDLEARLAAAQQGIRMWRESQGDESFPVDFVHALRRIAVEPITLEDFTTIAQILAIEDTAWFTSAASLNDSPHMNAPRTQILRALHNDTQMIRLLARFLRTGSSTDDPWLKRERDFIVSNAIEALLTQENAIAHANRAYDMLDAGLPMTSENRHEMTLLAARENCFVIDPTEACLRDDRVDEATASWHFIRNTAGPDSDRLRNVANMCMNVIANHLTQFHRNVLLANGLTDYERQYGPESVLVEKMQAQAFWAGQWLTRVQTLRPTVTDPQVIEFLDLIIEVSLGVMRQEWV